MVTCGAGAAHRRVTAAAPAGNDGVYSTRITWLIVSVAAPRLTIIARTT
jgi:hypothetical protein